MISQRVYTCQEYSVNDTICLMKKQTFDRLKFFIFFWLEFQFKDFKGISLDYILFMLNLISYCLYLAYHEFIEQLVQKDFLIFIPFNLTKIAFLYYFFFQIYSLVATFISTAHVYFHTLIELTLFKYFTTDVLWYFSGVSIWNFKRSFQYTILSF